MRRGTARRLACVTAALAGCHSDASSPSGGPAGATIHLGDHFTLVNDTHAPLCVTGFLLEGAAPPQLLVHGVLSGTLDATHAALPLDGKLLRLRFAASGPEFDASTKSGGAAATFVEETLAGAATAKVPEIARAPGVAEYLLGTTPSDPRRAPLEVHVVRRGDGLGIETKTAARVKLARTGFEVEERGDAVAIYRIGGAVPLLVQRCEENARPCLHPLMAPDLDGALTEFSPDHHHHQTGVYFGLPGLNGKSWFHRTREGAFHCIGAFLDSDPSAKAHGAPKLRWSVDDEWRDDGRALLYETQRWELTDRGDSYLLDLRWSARTTDVLKFEQNDYGGLFVRMPWTPEGGGHALDSEGHHDAECEGQRARWIDVEVPIPGRKDGKWGHIAMLDHPLNAGSPTFFRLDDQYGFGLARTRGGGFTVDAGKTMIARLRLVVYLGDFKKDDVEAAWKEFAAPR